MTVITENTLIYSIEDILYQRFYSGFGYRICADSWILCYLEIPSYGVVRLYNNTKTNETYIDGLVP